MNNLHVIPPDPTRLDQALHALTHYDAPTHATPICPPCTLAADLHLPHPCITQDSNLAPLLASAPLADWERLLGQLRAHPARPLVEGERMQGLRVVDRTWCLCQCARQATP